MQLRTTSVERQAFEVEDGLMRTAISRTILRPVVFGVVSLLMTGGCAWSGGLREVRTPSGGFLDCPNDELSLGHSDLLEDAVGWPGPLDALLAYPLAERRSGTPEIEDESVEEVTFVIKDPQGRRLARATVTRTERGWFVVGVERCGS